MVVEDEDVPGEDPVEMTKALARLGSRKARRVRGSNMLVFEHSKTTVLTIVVLERGRPNCFLSVPSLRSESWQPSTQHRFTSNQRPRAKAAWGNCSISPNQNDSMSKTATHGAESF